MILFNPRAYDTENPQPGDVVLFEAGEARIMEGHTEYVDRAGRTVERILAGPGSKVAWKHNELWIDGHRSNLQPLLVQSVFDQPELKVPPDMYYILSASRIVGRLGPTITANVFLHRRGSILGRAIVRHYPIWRWWWIN